MTESESPDDQVRVRQDTILFGHVDEKLGRELLLTEAGLQYADNAVKHPLTRQKLEAALRSITHKGENSNPQARAGELVTLSQSGVVLMFRGNMIYNTYIPTRDSWKYFKDQVRQPIKKGDDDEPESKD